MQKITPFLWFDGQAEEAVRHYTAIFKNSRVVNVTRYDEAGSRAAGRARGTVMTVAFELEGQAFVALNGPDSERAARVMKAMLPMKKIGLAALLRAAEGP